MIPYAGLNLIRSFLIGDAPDIPSHMAVGTGTTATASGDTAMETEVIRKAHVAKTTATPGAIQYTMSLLSTDANGSSLAEVGILNASSSGDMLSRQVHAAFSKTASFSVKYTVTHTQADS